jgi:hypothetical protein
VTQKKIWRTKRSLNILERDPILNGLRRNDLIGWAVGPSHTDAPLTEETDDVSGTFRRCLLSSFYSRSASLAGESCSTIRELPYYCLERREQECLLDTRPRLCQSAALGGVKLWVKIFGCYMSEGY